MCCTVDAAQRASTLWPLLRASHAYGSRLGRHRGRARGSLRGVPTKETGSRTLKRAADLCSCHLVTWVQSSVVRAADCRSAGPWLKSRCALFFVYVYDPSIKLTRSCCPQKSCPSGVGLQWQEATLVWRDNHLWKEDSPKGVKRKTKRHVAKSM